MSETGCAGSHFPGPQETAWWFPVHSVGSCEGRRVPGVRTAGDPWLPPSVSFTHLPPVWDGAGRGVGKDLARSHVSVWWRCVALSKLPCLSEWGSEDCEKNRVLLYGCMDTMLRNGEGGTRSWQSHLNGCSLLSCVCSPPHPCFYSLLSLSFRTNAPPPPPDLPPPLIQRRLQSWGTHSPA